jgi:hypothetical protein
LRSGKIALLKINASEWFWLDVLFKKNTARLLRFWTKNIFINVGGSRDAQKENALALCAHLTFGQCKYSIWLLNVSIALEDVVCGFAEGTCAAAESVCVAAAQFASGHATFYCSRRSARRISINSLALLGQRNYLGRQIDF